jgi:hypothetical protein
MRLVYLATLSCSAASTVLLIAPVSMHRLLFRRHRLDVLVSAAHRCAQAGLLLLGFALTGMTSVVFAAVSGYHSGLAPGTCALALFAVLWLMLPLLLRKRGS